jgi:DNA (cytosine-5)-methyltransferase 1
MITVGSLFSGIGGLELGLEMTGGFVTKWQVECDDYATRVLEQHWPNARRYRDVREVGRHNLEQVDLLCGGFPCQPFSHAARGRNVAIDLWPEMRRVVDDLRPTWVLAENVTHKAIGRARDDLRRMGWYAEIRSVGAHEIGADHMRNRWWVLAHAHNEGKLHRFVDAEVAVVSPVRDDLWGWACFPRGRGVAHGVPHRVDRLRCLGNAVVPQVAQWIGYRILEAQA